MRKLSLPSGLPAAVSPAEGVSKRFFSSTIGISTVVFILLGLPMLFTACSKLTEVSPGQVGYDYLPLELGRFAIYDATDISYSLTGAPVTQVYQIKEVVRDTFSDLAGQKSFRIERSTRLQPGNAWELDSVWTARQTLSNVVLVENNVPFIKIIFPLREGLKWNGNVFNSHVADEYQMKNVGKGFTVNGQAFDETLTVIQQNDSSLVNQDKRVEVYARNIGLIYQEKIIVQFCSDSEDCLGKGKIDFGTKHSQKIKGYGTE
jgi:hypothetical protein